MYALVAFNRQIDLSELGSRSDRGNSSIFNTAGLPLKEQSPDYARTRTQSA